ncbi:phage tail tape measure protein [Falsiroseomonas sp.]|uniref:phage tail tape measure protein n=1 Tax=Falsiroseomonas sp. TaxID=2870721 RepID=UPI003F71CCD0
MAADRNLVASFTLRLRDLVSPGLGVLQRRLQGIRDLARRIGPIGTLVAGISFAAPIASAAEFDQRLRDIAVTAGQAGVGAQAMIDRMRAEFGALALETGQRSRDVADGAGTLIAAGMEPALINRLLPTISRVATAANAAINDISNTAFTLSNTLGIVPEQMENSLAALVVAGKAGQVELRAMAQYIPQLASRFAAFGVTGRTAVNSLGAALQISRLTAGNEAEAANNTRNFFAAIASPEVIKNFRELGVDLDRLIRRAQEAGVNPMEAVVAKVRQMFPAGNALDITRLFGDEQARSFVLAMVQNWGRYLEIRNEVARADGTVISTDAATQMEGLNRQLTRFNELTGQFGDRVGGAFGQVQVAMIPALEAGRVKLLEIDQRFPGLIDGVLKFTGAAIVLTAVLGALGVVAPAIAAGFALITGPIGLAAAAIVAAGVLIYTQWDRISAAWQRGWAEGGQFAEMARIIRAAWSGLGTFFSGLIEGIGAAFQWLLRQIQPVLDVARAVFGSGSGDGPGVGAATSPEAQAVRRQAMGGRGAAGGFYEDGRPLALSQQLQGEIVVRATPGTEVERSTSSNRDLPITAATDRGPMLALP